MPIWTVLWGSCTVQQKSPHDQGCGPWGSARSHHAFVQLQCLWEIKRFPLGSATWQLWFIFDLPLLLLGVFCPRPVEVTEQLRGLPLSSGCVLKGWSAVSFENVFLTTQVLYLCIPTVLLLRVAYKKRFWDAYRYLAAFKIGVKQMLCW